MKDAEILRSVRFRQEREGDLKRLESLTNIAETQGLKNMTFQEARDLAALYRQTTSSLALAREISLDKSLVDYLEALTARAYLSVYAPQDPLSGLIKRFFRHSGPAAIRACWPYILIAILCIAFGFLTGFLLYFENPAWYYVFIPEGMDGGRGPDASTEYLRSVIYESDPDTQGLGAFATYLFSNNTRVAIFAFGLGVMACAPAILLTFYNGVIVGALYAVYVDRGLGVDLAGWLSIHGVTEISAICIAGGGGIRLGAAVLFPGNNSRSNALFLAGKDAVKLAIVAAVMLFAAAILEGFGRQLVQDLNMRFAIGWGAGVLWLAWFLFAGRSRS